MREMRQSARLLRTPIILMVLTVLMTLLMASMGGLMTGTTSPADAGSILFHTYFSLAYFVVALLGPGLAANSIASEREGKTWEALLLTGMRPAEVTRGKFLAAYTSIAMYIVMLAPVGALPFLFGGVTPLEVLIAFLFLFLFALLAVAFGLTISSKMSSLRNALLVTLVIAAPLSFMAFGAFGVGCSALAHELWNTVEPGLPVWLPTAYSRAPFGVEYLVYLVVLPITAISLPAWLLYEITRSNLTSVTDDRSHGLKRWYLVASMLLMITTTIPMFAVDARDRSGALIAGMCVYAVFIIFGVFLFAGEAIGPSRRVKRMLKQAPPLRRFLSPGVTQTAQLQLITSVSAVVVLAVAGVAFINTDMAARGARQIEELFLFTTYMIGFMTFVIGLAAMLRARSTGSTVPRVLLLVVLFFVATGPWILAAISGALGSSPAHNDLVIAAPSPFYVFFALSTLSRATPSLAVAASTIASISYAALGLLLLGLAHHKTKRIIEDHEAVLNEADRRLAAEDEAAAEATTSDAADGATPDADSATADGVEIGATSDEDAN